MVRPSRVDGGHAPTLADRALDRRHTRRARRARRCRSFRPFSFAGIDAPRSFRQASSNGGYTRKACKPSGTLEDLSQSAES